VHFVTHFATWKKEHFIGEEIPPGYFSLSTLGQQTIHELFLQVEQG
jgi:hypothetical protein